MVAPLVHVQAQQTCVSSRTKIVGGEKAKIETWPAQAALRRHSDEGNVSYYFCGGTAISDLWILTAAHCVPDFVTALAAPFTDGKGIKRQGRLEVVIGAQDLRKAAADQVYKVDRVVVHEAYRPVMDKALKISDPARRQSALNEIPRATGNDIALLRLERPWRGTPAVLSLVGAADPKEESRAQARIAGYGTTEHSPSLKLFERTDGKGSLLAAAPELLEAAIETIPLQQCRTPGGVVDPVYSNAAIGAGQVCAGLDQGGRDSCQGDSGGPLMMSDNKGCPRQIGIVSWGRGCALEKAYGVYTRVSHYAEWIQKHTGPLATSPSDPGRAPGTVLTLAQLEESMRQLEGMLGGAKGRIKLGIAGGNRVKLGDKVVFEASSELAGKLIILDINADREVMPIYPNMFVVQGDLGRIRAGQRVVVPGHDYPGFTSFQAVEPTGKGMLLALVVPDDFVLERVAAEKTAMAKGFAPRNDPPSYLMRLIRQVDTLLAARTRADEQTGEELKRWGYAVVDYEIVR